MPSGPVRGGWVGDGSPAGMGVSTVTAARILKGQLQNRKGEESLLEMDKFPYVALAKVRPPPPQPRGHPVTPSAKSGTGGRHRAGAEIRSRAGEGAGAGAAGGARVRPVGTGRGRGGRGKPQDSPASPGVIFPNKRLFFFFAVMKLEVLAAPRRLPSPRGGRWWWRLRSLPAEKRAEKRLKASECSKGVAGDHTGGERGRMGGTKGKKGGGHKWDVAKQRGEGICGAGMVVMDMVVMKMMMVMMMVGDDDW